MRSVGRNARFSIYLRGNPCVDHDVLNKPLEYLVVKPAHFDPAEGQAFPTWIDSLCTCPNSLLTAMAVIL